MFKNTIWALALMTLAFTGMTAEPLKDSAGKLFDVDLKTKTARFLKQDAAPDAEGKTKAWFTLKWSDLTTVTLVEKREDFKGMKGPLHVTFSGLPEKNAKLLKGGKRFMGPNALVCIGAKKVTGMRPDGKAVQGWFTPDGSSNGRGGVLEFEGKKVEAVARGGKRITVKSPLAVAELAKGPWKAIVTGKDGGDVLVAENIVLMRLADRLAEDDPKLPRVLSVGDSISINYFASAKAGLKGIANYHRIEDNCWATNRGMSFISYWLGDYTKKGRGWDVVLFNSGMHDMKQKTLGGPYAIPLKTYKKNLQKEIEIIKKTGAKMVFVTTTPVPNDLGSAQYAFRSKGAEKDFNTAARAVVKDYPEIRILDLAKVVHESKVMDTWRKGKDVHYWNKQEQAVLGEAVSAFIRDVLEASASKR